MKVPVILVGCCMLLASTLGVQADNSSGPAECCFKYYTQRLPKDKVVTFQRTHLHCARDGVVFTMKNGVKHCADPAHKWVQDVITYVESRVFSGQGPLN